MEKTELADKPGFVSGYLTQVLKTLVVITPGNHSSGMTITNHLVATYPEVVLRANSSKMDRTNPLHLLSRKVDFSLLGFASGGVFLASTVTRTAGALLPHHFTLTCLNS